MATHLSLWEQYSHEPYVATMRFWVAFVGEERLSDEQRAQMPARLEAGKAALKLMDEHLAGRAFFVGDRLTLADIALYAYTHVADKGGSTLPPIRTSAPGSSGSRRCPTPFR